MKFTVTIAKDGTPYFSVEGTTPGDSPAGARHVCEELRAAFVDWGEQSNPSGRSDTGKDAETSRFEVIE